MSSTAGNVEIMTIREVADYLKVTERTIYRLLSAKRLPGFKVGGSWRFKMVDIDLWIKKSVGKRSNFWSCGSFRGT